jgi:hypothetical protein
MGLIKIKDRKRFKSLFLSFIMGLGENNLKPK